MQVIKGKKVPRSSNSFNTIAEKMQSTIDSFPNRYIGIIINENNYFCTLCETSISFSSQRNSCLNRHCQTLKHKGNSRKNPILTKKELNIQKKEDNAPKESLTKTFSSSFNCVKSLMGLISNYDQLRKELDLTKRYLGALEERFNEETGKRKANKAMQEEFHSLKEKALEGLGKKIKY